MSLSAGGRLALHHLDVYRLEQLREVLELGVAAARAKATVGEISYAIEKVVGRHQAVIKSIQGVYANGMSAKSDKVVTARAMADALAQAEGESQPPPPPEPPDATAP